jgi:AraC-like DNA-binding protein
MHYLKAKIESPLSFVHCGHFIADENWKHMRRIIDNFEIIIGIKGTAYIRQGEEEFEVQPGRILLLLPGITHEGYRVSEAGTSFYWLHFHCRDQHVLLARKDALIEISPLQSKPYFSKLSDSILIPKFSAIDNIEKILIQFRQLLHITNSNYYSSLSADYLLTYLLTEITQQIISNTFLEFKDSDINSSKFVTILEWIKINISKELSVQDIADRFNINADYLTRLFKKHLGVSTMKYINGMKISRAKELLCTLDSSIKGIAYTLGFKDEKYFMKLFKAYENITPTEYRNAYYRTYLNNS